MWYILTEILCQYLKRDTFKDKIQMTKISKERKIYLSVIEEFLKYTAP